MLSDHFQTLTWYYKPIDMLVINFAVISEDIPNIIRFIDQTGYVFDRMAFDETIHEYLFGTYGAEAVSSFETTTQQSQQSDIDLYSRPNSGHSNAVFTVYRVLAINSSASTFAIAELASASSYAQSPMWLCLFLTDRSW